MDTLLTLSVLFLCYSFASPASSRNAKKLMNYGVVVETLLDAKKYHSYIRPNVQLGQPVEVNVTLSVISIDHISDDDMEYRITFTLQQKWSDSRLDGRRALRGYSKVLTMSGRLVQRIWVPDTYIVNSQTSFIHDVTTRNGLIRLYPNGTVLYVLRITSKVSCPMNLRKYPMDKQVCRLLFESWSFPDSDLVYKWSKAEECGEPNGSVHGVDHVQLSRFNITRCAAYSKLCKGVFGHHSQLVFEFHLKRNMLFFMMQTYIPAVLLVVLSWVSFWINRSSVPARVGLTATTVLSMTTHMIGVYNRGPESTSYIKAVDLYVCVCYGFVFLALVEYAAVHFGTQQLFRRVAKFRDRSDWDVETEETFKSGNHSQLGRRQNHGNLYTSTNNEDLIIARDGKKSQPFKHSAIGLREAERNTSHNLQRNETRRFQAEGFTAAGGGVQDNDEVNESVARFRSSVEKFSNLDVHARIAFPVLFGIFNIVYWWYYLGTK